MPPAPGGAPRRSGRGVHRDDSARLSPMLIEAGIGVGVTECGPPRRSASPPTNAPEPPAPAAAGGCVRACVRACVLACVCVFIHRPSHTDTYVYRPARATCCNDAP